MGPEFNEAFEKLYKVFIQQLRVVLPEGTNIPVAYEHGSDEEQAFVQNLALFFTAFFKVRRSSLSNLTPLLLLRNLISACLAMAYV